MRKSLLIKSLAFCIMTIFLFNSTIALAALTPTDISKHWAKNDINSANSEGWALIQNNKFNPNKAATREEVAWMLVGACKTVQLDGFDINKKADLKQFKDKPSTWAEGRMAIAVGNGYIGGYSDKTIKPKANITRAELAVLLSRLIKDSAPAGFLPFDDYIPNWSKDGIKKTYAKGIVTGYSNGAFRPSFKANANVTKAEALVMIQRWKKLNPAKLPPPCQEFIKIQKSLSGVTLNDNNNSIYYSGNDKTDETNIQNNFSITRRVDGSFTIYVNEFSDETFKALNTALKVIIPTAADKVVSETRALPQLQSKMIKGDNKNVSIKSSIGYVMIRITKL